MSASVTVEQLLDLIEETLDESTSVPLSGKHLVDVEKIRDYLDEVRLNLPGELRQARGIVSDRSQILSDANAQAEAVVKKAEERARILVSDEEVVKAAQKRASDIVAAAQAEARTLRQTVSDYCENMLRITEETVSAGSAPLKASFKSAEDSLTANVNQVKTVRANLRQNAKKNG